MIVYLEVVDFLVLCSTCLSFFDFVSVAALGWKLLVFHHLCEKTKIATTATGIFHGKDFTSRDTVQLS